MRALITGASSGIGLEMAKQLAARGYSLTLVARRTDRLRALARETGVTCQLITADLSDPEQVRQVYHLARGDDLEVVINNAGFGLFGPFAETSLERELEMISVNITAVHMLTKLFLRDFRRQGRGYLLNVASSAGFMAGPLMATYYATKNYVLRLTQAIAEELRREKSPVKIAALCPGPVATEFNQVADVRFAIRPLSAASVAEYGLSGLFAGRHILVPGAMMRLTLAARRLAPDSLVTRITYHIQHRKGSV